jgi:hypothetical protein
MTMDTFERALGFIDRCSVKVLLLSGGEPFEHPDVFRMADMVKAYAMEHVLMPAFASNGHFSSDSEKTEAVLRMGIGVQVTCDPRYYKMLLLPSDPLFRKAQFTFEDTIRTTFPCRRTRENGIVATKNAPNCFNIRSTTRSMGLLQGQLLLALQGRVCCPSINIDGTVVAGETDTCHPIGTVDSTVEEITEALCEMRCNHCGLVENLRPAYREAIGEQR